jgi:hypothetical protein
MEAKASSDAGIVRSFDEIPRVVCVQVLQCVSEGAASKIRVRRALERVTSREDLK